jgi:hypothetical protein
MGFTTVLLLIRHGRFPTLQNLSVHKTKGRFRSITLLRSVRVNESVNELNRHCARSKKQPLIVFVTQPTRSPDLNVLDLGIWNSLQSRVPTIRYDSQNETQMFQRIVEQVRETWKEYDSFSKLDSIYNTLKLIYREVIGVDGWNTYKLPHRK